ncbi:MAG TPA: serine hydrolase [Herpetosiphonaceae bacterium]
MSAWSDITALLNAAPGDYSVCVWSARGAQLYGYQEDIVRSAASLIKVPLAMAVYAAQESMPAFAMQTALTLNEADRVEGEGSLDRAPAGTIKTVRELVAHALIESDNTASNLLIDRLGFEQVNQFIGQLGLETRLRRKFMDFAALAAGRDNTTTAREMCAIFYHLVQQRYAEVLEFLGQSVGDQKLEAGLPPGTPLAHKVGDLPGVEHDAGIVFAPHEPYIVAALSVELPDVESGRHTIAQASRLIWELMTSAVPDQPAQ